MKKILFFSLFFSSPLYAVSVDLDVSGTGNIFGNITASTLTVNNTLNISTINIRAATPNGLRFRQTTASATLVVSNLDSFSLGLNNSEMNGEHIALLGTSNTVIDAFQGEFFGVGYLNTAESTCGGGAGFFGHTNVCDGQCYAIGNNLTCSNGIDIGMTDATKTSFETTGVTARVPIKTSTITAVSSNKVVVTSTLVVSGVIVATGTTPTMGSCGTSPSVVGTDLAGQITVGTGGVATSCAITFAHTWKKAPSCISNHEGAILVTRAVATTTALTIDAATPLTASGKLDYICIGID